MLVWGSSGLSYANFIISARTAPHMQFRNLNLALLAIFKWIKEVCWRPSKLLAKPWFSRFRALSHGRDWHTFSAMKAMHISGCCHALRMKRIIQPSSWAFCGTGMFSLSFYRSYWSSKFRMVTEISELLLVLSKSGKRDAITLPSCKPNSIR